MSVLTQKHILVIGEETNQISKIEAALITYGATITTSTCEDSDVGSLKVGNIDLVLLNHLHNGNHCRDTLNTLKKTDLSREIPIFALVENSTDQINDALALGAADYITPGEDVHDVMEKIKVIFGDGATTGSESVIDLTPSVVAGTGEGIRVYAIEDDPLLRNLLAIKFQKSNIPFEVDSDGENVVANIKNFRPQIVILDLMLPGKDGFTLLREIRADAEIADLPVIIFSNKDTQADRATASQLGAKGFYIKALTDLSDLMGMIEQHAKH